MCYICSSKESEQPKRLSKLILITWHLKTASSAIKNQTKNKLSKIKKMKKFLLTIFTIGAFAGLASAQCNELFISEYQEGYNNNKALEIFNPTGAPITLTGNYRIVRWSNGSSTSDADVDYVQPLSGTIPSGGTFSAILDKRVVTATGADTILWAALLAKADSLVNAGMGAYYSPIYGSAGSNVQGSKCIVWNGDDAISLQKNNIGTWTNVDIFGKIGERPTNGNGTFSPTGGWTDTSPFATGIGSYLSKDKTLIRQFGVQSGVSTNPALFDILAEWDSAAVNTFTNLGYHECLCTVGLKEINNGAKVSLYPNPSVNGTVVVRGADVINSIELLNQVGEVIFSENGNGINKTYILNTANYAKGIYMVAVGFKNGNRTISKISIQ